MTITRTDIVRLTSHKSSISRYRGDGKLGSSGSWPWRRPLLCCLAMARVSPLCSLSSSSSSWKNRPHKNTPINTLTQSLNSSMWTRCELHLVCMWALCELFLDSVHSIWTLSGLNVLNPILTHCALSLTSMWTPSQLCGNSMWTLFGLYVNSMWALCELFLDSIWTLWTLCELFVNSLWPISGVNSLWAEFRLGQGSALIGVTQEASQVVPSDVKWRPAAECLRFHPITYNPYPVCGKCVSSVSLHFLFKWRGSKIIHFKKMQKLQVYFRKSRKIPKPINSPPDQEGTRW